jgi:hypothetical protein
VRDEPRQDPRHAEETDQETAPRDHGVAGVAR